jgi:hypothetical protein
MALAGEKSAERDADVTTADDQDAHGVRGAEFPAAQ